LLLWILAYLTASYFRSIRGQAFLWCLIGYAAGKYANEIHFAGSTILQCVGAILVIVGVLAIALGTNERINPTRRLLKAWSGIGVALVLLGILLLFANSPLFDLGSVIALASINLSVKYLGQLEPPTQGRRIALMAALVLFALPNLFLVCTHPAGKIGSLIAACIAGLFVSYVVLRWMPSAKKLQDALDQATGIQTP
jgi:hypothetical protein